MVLRRYNLVGKYGDSSNDSELLKRLVSENFKLIKTPKHHIKLIKEASFYDLGYPSYILINPISDYLISIYGENLKKVSKAKSYLEKKLKNHDLRLREVLIC